MKKLLLSITLAFAVLFANGQITLNTDWSLLSGSSSLIGANSGTSVAYNPATGNLLFPDRNNKISILSTVDGTAIRVAGVPKELKVDAAWTDGSKYYKIRAAQDGAIYSVNLITSASGGSLAIFRWENEDDQSPTKTNIPVAARTGDSFGVYGTGNNTKLYISGSANDKIYVCSVTAGVIALERTIAITSGWARSSISPISENELIIAGPSGTWVRKIATAPGGTTLLAGTVVISKQNSAFANAEYFADGTDRYITVHGAVINASMQQIGVEMEVYNVNNFANPLLVSKATLMTPPANQNSSAYADVAVIKNAVTNNHTFFHTVLNNGLASYTSVVPLPVSLTSFNANLVKGQSTLSWETASEKNNSGFEVLRSTNGKDFEKINFIPSKGQNGNSTKALSYTYVDRTAKAGVNYYQLKQIDLNGDSELFKDIKSVNVSLGAAHAIVFPNPASTYVSVNAGSADFKGVKYELFDASGKKVLSEKATAEQQDISLSKLPASVYILKISKDNIVQKTVKLVKQ